MSKESVTVADIDYGTNSVRLKATRVGVGGMHEAVSHILHVIRLGQGMDKAHRLADEMLECTHVAAREFASVIAEHPIDGLRLIATSATYDTEDRKEFEDEIECILSVHPEVIPGTEEVDLNSLSATSVVNRGDLSAPYLMIDLGGGSTELVIGSDGISAPATQVRGAFPMNIDSVRMTERHLTNDPPTQTQVGKAAVDVDEHIDGAFHTMGAGKACTIIGVSGMVATMIALAMGLREYGHTVVDGHRLSLENAYAVNDKFFRVTRAEHREYKTIHSDRIDVIDGGAMVWSRVLARVSEAAKVDYGEIIDSFVASEHGLLDGIMFDYDHRLLAQ